jgi:predicted regulator of Ras-like GTPase activity (Roadblock/LC7/MglB family)
VAELSFDTPTMAELYFKQGHPRRAAAIYRKLARDRPDDQKTQERLAEIEAALAAQQGDRMSFREHMQHIVESTPGALASVVMGFDGIAIDSFQVGSGELDVPTLMIEYAAAARQLNRGDVASSGGMQEVTVSGDRHSAIVRPITKEYFLAVILGPNSLLGKARYLMRVAAPLIAKELG